MRSARIISFILLTLMVFAACTGEEDPVVPGGGLSEACLITGFSIEDPVRSGVINTNDNTIVIDMPADTVVTALTSVITVSEGATVTPASGVAQDFTAPVVYTVVAEDGASSNQYTVTVRVAASSDKEITSFFFPTTPISYGSIDPVTHAISVAIPYGVDPAILVASFGTSGTNVYVSNTLQVSGISANDFSSPVTYTVCAADGSSTNYTVTVTNRPASTECDIVTLSVNGVAGVITGTNVSVVLPFGTALTALSPAITNSAGATVNPVSGAAQDFSSGPVTYTVTAEDGSTTQSYAVSVTTAAGSTACDITAFSISGVNGTISGTNISLVMPYGTSLSSLTPTITVSADATINPASGASQDFSGGPVSYTVTAQNGTTTKQYTVSVTASPVPDTWHTETFDNTSTSGSSYAAGTTDSNDAGITWSYYGRADSAAEVDSGNAGLMIGKDGSGYLQATLPNGCGKLKFRFRKPFSDTPSVVVKVDGVTVHTTALATSSAQDSEEIVINASGPCVLRLEAGSGGHRVNVDNLSWTDGAPPETDPPTVAISSPSAGATVTAYQLSVSGTAADTGADASGVASVWTKLDSGSFVQVSGTTSWSHLFNSVSEGAHTVSVYSVDAAGNHSSTNTVSVTLSHPVDTTNPGVSITTPTDGASIIGAVSVSGTASDDLSGVKAVYVKVDSGSFVQASGTTSWSHSFSSLTTGSHTISVYSEDNAGNTSATNTISVTVAIPKWTVMVYLVADNDLEGAGVEDFQEMENGIYDAVAAGNSAITNNLNIIVMFDRSPSYDTSDGNWSDTRLFRILPDSNMSTSASDRLDDGNTSIPHHIANLNEKQMDDPATLSWFLNYCKTEFPAENYGLILWNHGGGTRSARTKSTKTTRPLKEVCWDDTSGSWEPLYLDEIQQAVKANFNSSDKLGFIGYDACLMGMVETAYEFRDLAKYMIASMQLEQGDGWDYEYIFKNMGDGSTLTAEGFAKLLVEQYRYFIGLTGTDGETLAAADLTQMASLKTAIDALAVAIHAENKKTAIEGVRNASVNYLGGYPEYYPFYDLWDFCNRLSTDSINGFSSNLKTAANGVISAMQNVIVRCFGQSGNGQSSYYYSDADAKRGLSIFFSNSSTDWANQGWYTIDDNSSHAWDSTTIYGNIDFCTYSGSGVNTWRDLMNAWYEKNN